MGKMMKNNHLTSIIFVENGIGYGGAIICLRHLARNLNPQRYHPIVVTGRNDLEYQEIANEAEWKYIRDRYFDTTATKRYLQKSEWPDRVPGIRFLLSQIIARSDDIVNFLPFFIRFLFLVIRKRPGIIHTNNEPMCNRAALLAGKLLRVPVICHVRGTQKISRITRWLYQLPDFYICVSHWISDGLAKLGIPDNKRIVIYDGIDLGERGEAGSGEQFRHEHGLAEDTFAVGLVGLLIPWKGQEIFIEAANFLRDKIPGLCMLIIGGTPDECSYYENSLKDRVSDESLDDIVKFTGHIENMPDAYNGLDIVVSASTSPEPLGTVVIESMALAKPLIAPAHGGAAEMADHMISALLFTPGNSQSLADCIFNLYKNPQLRSTLGKHARAKALKTFDVNQHTAAVEEVYKTILCK